MILAQPVYHPVRPDITLLKPGAELDLFGIPRLLELGVHEIWIRYPGLDDLIKFANPRILNAYRGLISTIGLALNSAMLGAQAHLDYYAYRQAVTHLIDQLTDDPSAAFLVGELVRASHPFIRHAGNTCLVSLLMGLKLDHYLIQERSRISPAAAKDVSNLGVGALFHDIGLLRVEPAHLGRWCATHDESDPAWREHVRLGHQMVHDHLDPAAAAVVLHHHQRFDGTGFPSKATGDKTPPKGSEIHIFARIAACADVFDRLRFASHAPGEQDVPPLPTVRVLNMMRREPFTKYFDPVVLSALHHVVPPFAPGSVVSLSNGQLAAISDWSPQHPCRPTVIPIANMDAPSLRDPAYRLDEPRAAIDLWRHPDLSIASTLGEDVQADLY